MRVRIGALELDVSLEELDELVQRYGNIVATSGEGGAAHPGVKPKVGEHHGTTDSVILKKLVDAGTQGVPTSVLGDMLGRRGKATRGAARKLAQRMGVVSDPAIDPFEESRVGTQRGLRIKASFMDIAKAHLSK